MVDDESNGAHGLNNCWRRTHDASTDLGGNQWPSTSEWTSKLQPNFDEMEKQTLPEAQRTQSIEFKTWIILFSWNHFKSISVRKIIQVIYLITWVRCTMFWFFLVFFGTFWFFLVLLGTFWYLLVFSGTFCFLVLLGTSSYFLVLFSAPLWKLI